MLPIEFRTVHNRVDGVSIEVWLEVRVRPLVGGVLGEFGPWQRLDAVSAVDQHGNAL